MKLSPMSRVLARIVPATALALLALLGACTGKGGSAVERITAAKALIQKNDGKGAIIELKNALQKDPKSAEARLLLGKMLLLAGDSVPALVELGKAQELQSPDDEVVPEIARAMLVIGDAAKLIMQYGSTALKDGAANADLKTSLANAYAIQGQLPKARRSAEEALKSKPDYSPALIMQARISAAEGNLDDALALLDTVLKADPSNERAGLLKGELLLSGKRDPEGALATFREAAKNNPGSIMARASVANLLFQIGKGADTRTELEEMQKLAPNHPETLLLQAQTAFLNGDQKATLEITERLLKGAPDNVRVLELAGAAQLRDKNYVRADQLLSQAVKLMPQMPRPRLLLAQTYLRTGQAEKTLELLRPVLESKQPDAMSLTLAGEAYLQTGDNKRSEEAFRQATTVAPKSAVVRTSAAIAQVARGDMSGTALAELESVAANDKDTRGDLALVSARLRKNDTEGALKAIATLEKKIPDRPLPHLLRGRVLMVRNDLAGATKSFEAALAKDPGYFPAVASLAAIEVGQGKNDEARQRFEAHLKAHPKAYQAKVALAELAARTGAAPEVVTGHLRDAVKIGAAEVAPRLLLIRRLIAANDGKAALAAAQDASAALPNDVAIEEALGEAQIAGGDAQRAISTFRKLSSAQPKNAGYLVRLSDAYRANKEGDAAILALKQALQLQPDLGAARNSLVGLLIQQKHADEAMSLAREQQKRKPQDASGYQLEGEIQAQNRNWDGAIASLRSAVRLDPSAPMQMRLHAALRAGGKAVEAEKLAADWIKGNPKDPVFKFYLGDLAMGRKDLTAAEATYREVLELQPNNALAMNNLAWLMAAQRRPGAVAMAEKANALLPDRAPLLDTLSSALEAENKLPKAIEVQTRAIRLQPEDPNLVLRLGKLYIKSGDKVRARAELESLAKLGDKFSGQTEVSTLLRSL